MDASDVVVFSEAPPVCIDLYVAAAPHVRRGEDCVSIRGGLHQLRIKNETVFCKTETPRRVCSETDVVRMLGSALSVTGQLNSMLPLYKVKVHRRYEPQAPNEDKTPSPGNAVSMPGEYSLD